MKKGLYEQLLEAGVLPERAVRQMEYWRSIPRGSAGKIGKLNQAKVVSLREDLELHTLPAFKETVLDIEKIMSKARPVTLSHRGEGSLECFAGVDLLKRYIFEIPALSTEYASVSNFMRPLSVITDRSLEGPLQNKLISEISVLYSTVSEGTSVPTHWFCTTEPFQGGESCQK